MKRLLLILFGFGILTSTYAQDPETKLKALESKDSTILSDTLKKNNPSKIDSTKIRLGKNSITIIDDDEFTNVRFRNRKYRTHWDSDFDHKRSFKGHWAGIEFGINGYMDKNQSITMSKDMWYLDLKQARSWNFNVNFMQYSIGFGSPNIGLVTGMGLEFNNYHFSNPVSLMVDNTTGSPTKGMTVVDSTFIKGNFTVDKTKLSTTHLTVPLLLEFQIPTGERGRKVFISAGVIGELRIGAHTKIVYDDEGKRKDKNKEDFNLSTFRYSFTARMGYRGLKLFANYSPVPLFEKDKGPEVYPYSVGLVLLSF